MIKWIRTSRLSKKNSFSISTRILTNSFSNRGLTEVDKLACSTGGGGVTRPPYSSSSSLLLSSPVLSDTQVDEPQIRALRGTASHICKAPLRPLTTSSRPLVTLTASWRDRGLTEVDQLTRSSNARLREGSHDPFTTSYDLITTSYHPLRPSP